MKVTLDHVNCVPLRLTPNTYCHLSVYLFTEDFPGPPFVRLR